jgi:phytoene dehydrogenase-like protein
VDPDVIFIGAGHNGLVAAFYLARAGLRVEMLEAQAEVGGACKTEELIPGYRFSTCANYFYWARSRVVEDMRLFDRGVEVGGGLWTRVLTENRPFAYWPEEDRLREEIARFSKPDSDAWASWQRLWDAAARLIGPYLLSYPPTLADLVARAEKLGLSDTLQLLMTNSLAEVVDRYFESEEMRSGFIVPHDLGSMYDHGGALTYGLAAAARRYSETGAEMPEGFVRGGMGAVTQTMATAAREHGVSIRTSSPVRRVLVADGRAVGVELANGEQLAAAAVVSNADPKRTFLTLIDPDHLPAAFLRRIRGLRTDVAPLKFHCALSEAPEYPVFAGSDLAGKGLFLIYPTRAYQERAWDDARHGRLPEAPLMTVMSPSTWDDTLAPPGHHTVSFWIQFAPVRLRDGTWPDRREEMAERLLTQIDKYSPNFRRALVDHVLFTPWDLEQRVLLTDGNIHHVDITPSQMLWQRPLPELARYRAPLQGLYLCGAGQHPYGEVSGGPGHNAAHVVLEDLGRIAPEAWQEIRRSADGAERAERDT